MSDDTAPMKRPVNIDQQRWHCLLCQAVGYRGVSGWDEHYMAWHYTPKKREGK